MVSPKDLKPKIHERIGLRALETKKKKRKGLACQDQRIKESPVERIGLGSPEATKGSRSSGRAT